MRKRENQVERERKCPIASNNCVQLYSDIVLYWNYHISASIQKSLISNAYCLLDTVT